METAKFIHILGNILPHTYTISYSKNKFYNFKYDLEIYSQSRIIHFLKRIIYGPILLGYFANRIENILYIGSMSFLLNRDFEFKFLKSKKVKIIFMFLGTDIRSPKLTLEVYEKLGYDNFLNYIGSVDPTYLSNQYDDTKKALSKSADTYGDLIFSAPVDQKSYIKTKQYFPPYFYNAQDFHFNNEKFHNMGKIKILHAPSSPMIKGTPLVRAAIKKLEIQGYDFEYVELQNIPNEVVIEHLKNSHIVLNQFYGLVPGMFGIEAMANNCAVLMSADPLIETGLPHESQDAWMITRYWEVYDNLKYLLDNPAQIKDYANKGYEFTYKYYTYDAARLYMNKILKDNGIIN